MNHEKEVDQAAKLVTTTNSNLLEFFATCGKEPFQVKSTLLLENKLGLRELMKPIVSAYNTKVNGNTGGRPEELDVDKSDSGVQTSDNDSNENRV